MALIDKGTHMEDADTGKVFAKTSTGPEKKRKKRRHLIKPADSDILFGLYLEKAQGRLTLTEISDATGWPPQTLCGHFKRENFAEKAAKILKTTKSVKSITPESVATNLATRLLKGAEAHDESIEDMMHKTRQHFKRMKPQTIIKQARDIKAVVEIGRQHYRKDVDEQKASNAPVMNIAVLLGDGVRVVTDAPAT